MSSIANRVGLVSVDGAEATPSRWQVLEEVLAAKRQRNDQLPIFLFGDESTAEMVPASVLKHANAFTRLFSVCPSSSPAIARSAQLYLDRLPPPMFKALMEYTLHASYSAHAAPWRWRGVSQEPGRPALLSILRREHAPIDVSVSVGKLGSLLDHTGPIAEGERNAARIFGADHAVRGRGHSLDGQEDRLARHGGQGRSVLCDRNRHKSILHSLIMTGAMLIYLVPSRTVWQSLVPFPKTSSCQSSLRNRGQPVCEGHERQGLFYGGDQLDLRLGSVTTSMASSNSSATRWTCCISTRLGTPTRTSTSFTTATTLFVGPPFAVTARDHFRHPIHKSWPRSRTHPATPGPVWRTVAAGYDAILNEASMNDTSMSPPVRIIASAMWPPP